MATTRAHRARGRQARRHVVGSDHPDRRQPRHLHQDRLRQPRGRLVQEHVVAVPRLQRVHEGQGPARRALHHQPHLRHLRRQPRGLLVLRAEDGLRRQDRRRWASGSSTSARRPSTSSTTSSSRTTWCSWTSASRWSSDTNPRVLEQGREDRGAARGRPRLPHDRATSCAPTTRSRARRTSEALQMSRIGREMICLMEGRHVHPSTIYPGGVGTRGRRRRCSPTTSPGCCAAWTSSRRPSPMNDDVFDFFYEALPGYEEVGRPADPARLLGRVQQPRPRRLRLPPHGRLGQRDVRHPGRRRRRRAGDDEPRRHQPRHPDPARLLLLRGLGERGDVRRQGPAGQPGRQAPPVEPDDDPASRRSATSTAATTRG